MTVEGAEQLDIALLVDVPVVLPLGRILRGGEHQISEKSRGAAISQRPIACARRGTAPALDLAPEHRTPPFAPSATRQRKTGRDDRHPETVAYIKQLRDY